MANFTIFCYGENNSTVLQSLIKLARDLQSSWHSPPNGWRADHPGSFAMFASFQTRQILVSLIGALVFASVAITTAAPIFPVA